MKKLGIIFALLVLAVSMVNVAFADAPTGVYVNGNVYSGDGIATPPVEGAVVHVTCGTAAAEDSLPTTVTGFYDVLFDDGGCTIGDTAQACVGTHCGSSVISESLENPIMITGVDIFNVPEFGIATAMLALVGATLMFVVIRKRN
jgi:hypothetical protein